MATNIQRHNKHYSGDGVPTAADFGGFKLRNNDTYQDRITKKMYKYHTTSDFTESDNPYLSGSGGSGQDGKSAYQIAVDNGFVGTEQQWLDSLQGEDGIDGQNGRDGTDATVSVKSVTTTTLPAGSQASVTITDANASSSVAELEFKFDIPKGEDGTGGGGGISIPGVVVYNDNLIEFPSEIQVTGLGNTQTVTQSGNTYPATISITGTDLTDFANLQYALYLANLKGKRLISSGKFYTNRGLDLGKNSYRINWTGGGNTEIITQNNNAYTILGRPSPTDMTDANIMIQAIYNIDGIIIIGKSNQIGFEPGPSYHSNYSNMSIRYCSTGYHVQFSLNTTFFKCNTWACNYGFIAENLTCTGATVNNSQSNLTKFVQCHVGGGWNGTKSELGFGIYASANCIVDTCIIEQRGCKVGVDVDYRNSTTVKYVEINNTHIEGVEGNAGGSTESFFRVRMVGVALIQGVNSQFAGILLNAGSNGGQLQMILKGITWVRPLDGKVFYNAGNTSFLFKDCSWQTSYKWNKDALMTQFTGTNVIYCWSDNNAHCGPNTVTIDNLKQ